MADVFVSYRRAERERVSEIAKRLEKDGFSVWFDVRLEPGETKGFDAEIEHELEMCAAVLVCWSSSALKSNWVRGEALKGLEAEKLVPIFLEKIDLPVPFNTLQTLDFCDFSFESKGDAYSQLVSKLAKLKRLGVLQAKQIAAYLDVREPIWPSVLAELIRRPRAGSSTYVPHWLTAGGQSDLEAMLTYLRETAENYADRATSLSEASRTPNVEGMVFEMIDDLDRSLTSLDRLQRETVESVQRSFDLARSALKAARRYR